MSTPQDLIPDVEILLTLAPDELAFNLLELAREQGGMFHPDTMSDSYTSNYPTRRWPQIEIALSEAWQWLRINMLIVPAAGASTTEMDMRS